MAKTKRSPIKAGLSHRRRVTRLKFILPAITIGLFIGLVALLEFPDLLPRSGNIAGIGELGITMQNVHLEGETESGAAYHLYAATAYNVDANEDHFFLEGVRGELMLNSGSPTLEAPMGFYDNAERMLDLEAPVHLNRDDGLEILAGTTRFILAQSLVQSDDGVNIRLLGGPSLRAQKFLVNGDTEKYDFSGGIHVIIPSQNAKAD